MGQQELFLKVLHIVSALTITDTLESKTWGHFCCNKHDFFSIESLNLEWLVYCNLVIQWSLHYPAWTGHQSTEHSAIQTVEMTVLLEYFCPSVHSIRVIEQGSCELHILSELCIYTRASAE